MKKAYLFALFLLYLPPLQAQDKKVVPIARKVRSPICGQTVSFTRFIKELTSVNPDVKEGETVSILFDKITVKFDHIEDREGMDQRFSNPNAPILNVIYDTNIAECTFDATMWWVMNRICFKGTLDIAGTNTLQAIFKNCIFENTLRMASNQINFLDFENCQFQHGLRYHLNNLRDYIKFENSTFSINPKIIDDTRGSLFDNFVIEAHLFDFNQKNEVDLTIQNCIFRVENAKKNLPRYAVNISNSNFVNLLMVGNQYFTNINLSQTSISNQFLFNDSELHGKIIIDALNINPLNARIQWTSLANSKISVYARDKKSLINGEIQEKITDEILFSNLISCYATFYSVFKSQGNKLYANACYVEWKNIETSFLKNRSQLAGEPLGYYFNYLMNIFLRDFCDYGTNPLKSIYLSGLVLVLFAFLYFISPFNISNQKQDEKNTNNKSSVYIRLQLYARYFLEKGHLYHLYKQTQTAEDDQNHIKAYLALIETHKTDLPHFFVWIAHPSVIWGFLKAKSNAWFYRMIDFFPERWSEMKKGKRILASWLFFWLIFFDFAIFLSVRCLDALMLSLNVFSTLGFGEVPVRGFIRYLTVIEGFVGWFLLSIFSVSLISQVIQ